METVQPEITRFHREYLWELSIPQTQLLALADAVPGESYGWRPAQDARSLSEVLVHIAAGNFMLLYQAGVRTPEVIDVIGPVSGERIFRWVRIVRRNLELERTVYQKSAVIDLLKRSFEAVVQSFTAASEEYLGAQMEFFGENTTVRRLYLRILAHSHEHMGQAIAYTRSIGVRVPWPDPVKELERIVAGAGSR
ncbi:MAG TPA: DinB family protein [Terracidiphilus sp.]|nr:DinB family protein [Terracidiphilus sp.]